MEYYIYIIFNYYLIAKSIQYVLYTISIEIN